MRSGVKVVVLVWVWKLMTDPTDPTDIHDTDLGPRISDLGF